LVNAKAVKVANVIIVAKPDTSPVNALRPNALVGAVDEAPIEEVVPLHVVVADPHLLLVVDL